MKYIYQQIAEMQELNGLEWCKLFLYRLRCKLDGEGDS